MSEYIPAQNSNHGGIETPEFQVATKTVCENGWFEFNPCAITSRMLIRLANKHVDQLSMRPDLMIRSNIISRRCP